MPESPTQFQFHSDAVEDDTFLVEAFAFREEMSTPFTLELTLLTRKKPDTIKPEEMIKNEAYLEMKHSVALKSGDSGVTTRRVYGMVSAFEMVEKVREYIRCRVVMVPRLWKLSLTQESRVFQDVDISKLVADVLKNPDSHNFTSDDFDFKLAGSYSGNEYIVQYNESDLDFIHRWLETEGVFYYFTHSEETKDKVVFADSPDGYLSSIGNYRYRTSGELQSLQAEGAHGAEESVSKFVCHMNTLPASIKLRDYNYRTPSVENEAEAKVEESSGVGTVYEYGDHFKTPSDGKAVAKVRAQAIRCREKVFEGISDIRPLRPGATFALEEHFNPDFNGDYVVLSVNHRMHRSFSETGTLSDAVEYDNDFQCIKSDIVFRPERKTEWPVLMMLNAVVDADGDGKYAEIDDQGRYKVKLPFDCSDNSGGKASRWIRMAQPYAGAEMGMHFPLHKGTEVLLTFINGDPDRPIISAAVPNPETGSPVRSSNQTQSAIQTGGGIRVVFEDNDGSQRLHMATPTKNTFFQIGAKTDGAGGSSGEGGGGTGAAAPGAEDGVSMGTEADINFQSAKDYIHRTGGNVTIETTKNELKITRGDQAEETHGNKREWTKGNSEAETVGNSKETTTGNKEETTTGDSKETTVGSTDETFTGTKTSKSLSAENEMTLGAKNSLSASIEAETAVGAKSEIFGGIKFESTNGLSTEANKGGKLTICDMAELKTAKMKLDEASAEHEIKGGDVTIDGTLKLNLEGGTSITIKCGGSSITLSPSEIKMSAPTITIEGTGKVDVKSDGMATVKGSAIKVDGPVMEG